MSILNLVPSIRSGSALALALASLIAAHGTVVLGAEPLPLRIAPAEGARFELRVHKTGLMNGKTHVFLFDRYEGVLAYDPASSEQSRVELTIEAKSLRCTDKWVKAKEIPKIEQVALSEMMQVGQHPRLRFASESVRSLGDGKFDVSGSLTIRGIGKPVVVRVRLHPGANSLWIEGESQLSMKDWGLKPPSAALGMVGTKNGMDVAFVLVASPES
jgi:polyisoprenoid-binding protein YceI